MRQGNATRSVKSWKRKAWGVAPASLALPAKLFRVEMIHDYTGIIEGEGVLQYLFANNGDNTGCFLALEQITGSVEGRPGSFVFQHSGRFGDGKTVATMLVLPGSGTGALHGLRGEAVFEAEQHLEHYPLVFTYEL